MTTKEMKQAVTTICRRQSGVTLIEALVTLFVLSVGLVGLAALHLTSLQSAHSSYFRSIASAISLDFEERLWIAAANELKAPGQCLVGVADLAEDLQEDWVKAPGLPGLEIAVKAPVVRAFTRPQPGAAGIWTDRWQEMTMTIEWTEGRFRSDTQANERFDYLLRIPCVSEYNLPPPP